MQKGRKHQFKYQDPEETQTKKSGAKSSSQVLKSQTEVPDYVISDLKRTGIVIGLFIITIIFFYFIEKKTDYLQPVLKIFGI